MTSFTRIDDKTFIGPQPTEQDLREASQQGIRTVVDFRLPSETATSNQTLTTNQGMAYVNIPVSKAALSTDQISVLDSVMKEQEGSFLLHCATGARAALFLSLSKAKQQGWTSAQTFAEAKRMGFDLEMSPEFAEFVLQTLG
jgi:uncharacterized protein (TIGR01244 family)